MVDGLPIDSCKTEVLLRITIEHALKSDNLVNYLSKKASQNLNVVARIAPAVNASQLLWTDFWIAVFLLTSNMNAQ